jgi:hypothetical protein
MTEYPRRKPNPFGHVIRWFGHVIRWFGHVIRWLRDMIEGRPPAVMTEYPRRNRTRSSI